MDLSMAAYIMVPVMLFFLIHFFIQRGARQFFYVYTFLFSVLFAFAFLSDSFMFRSWGTRLDTTFLKYLKSPREAFASIAHLPFYLIIPGLAIIIFSFHLLSKQISEWAISYFKNSPRNFLTFSAYVLLTGSLIIPMRGGLQLAPINQSSVYFSHNNFANLAALNPIWNFMQASMAYAKEPPMQKFSFLDEKEASHIIDSLYSGKPTVAPVEFKGKNIILITWESFTAKVIDSSYGGVRVTPNFNELKKHGIYFTNTYASGDRTDKGLVAVLSSYPAQPLTSIIKDARKAASLPSFPKELKSAGYHTSFIYGGEPEFANLKSYLLSSGFDKIIGIERFQKEDLNSKWGAHDGVVADKILASIDTTTSPFFLHWMTLSSHEPFEVPVKAAIQGRDDVSMFLNSLHYTDQVIGNFISVAKTKAWWQNTIIIITADHGHPFPVTANRMDNFRIPLLITGGGVMDSSINTITSQLDIAPTILQSLQIPSEEFDQGRNLFDAKDWAFFSFNNGFGLVNEKDQFLFDNVGKRAMQPTLPNIHMEKTGKAFQQKLMQDYLSR